MAFQRGFDFDSSNLSRNIAELDAKVQEFIDDDIEIHTTAAVATMKRDAPWRDHSGHARRTLWGEHDRPGGNRRITLGHGAEYGVYLEENNEKRFAIVGPTIIAVGTSFMRSLERMFAKLEMHAPPTATINPMVTTRPNTTRPEVVQTVDRRGQSRWRDAGGRFVSAGTAKRLARNAASRARYAARKAAGTLPTKRTKRG